jgi:hypothetical protein
MNSVRWEDRKSGDSKNIRCLRLTIEQLATFFLRG